MRDQRSNFGVAPRAGFEPATIRLTVECSTAELPRNRRKGVRERAAYNKAFRACKGPNGWLRHGIKNRLKRAAAQGFVAISDRPVPARSPAAIRGIPRRHGPSRQIDSIGRRASSTPGFTELIRCQLFPTDLMKAGALDRAERHSRHERRRMPASGSREAVETHDSEHLDEVARLIGRLAVTIE